MSVQSSWRTACAGSSGSCGFGWSSCRGARRGWGTTARGRPCPPRGQIRTEVGVAGLFLSHSNDSGVTSEFCRISSADGFDLLGSLQRTWRLMWRASCLWTLMGWAFRTPVQTTVTPAWKRPGYDSRKRAVTSLTSPSGREEEKHIPKTKDGGSLDEEVTVQHFFLFLAFSCQHVSDETLIVGYEWEVSICTEKQ